MPKPNNQDEEICLAVARDLVLTFWAEGRSCPVICHGLVGSPQLNDKVSNVGDISVGKDDEYQMAVHFEEKTLKPSMALIKHVNL